MTGTGNRRHHYCDSYYVASTKIVGLSLITSDRYII